MVKLSKDQQKSLDKVTEGINKKFGNGSIMRLGDQMQKFQVEVVSTGSLNLDRALGGGIPLGRSIELYGPQMSGKTTLLNHIIREAQKKYETKLCAIVDAEHAYDVTLAAEYGVDVENLYISQPSSGEEALDIVEALARSGMFSIIGVDSVSALLPTAEADADMAQASIGLQARLMSKALRKLTHVLSESKTTAVFINQLREKVGVLYGNPEVTSGGRALAFYSSVRINVRQGEQLKTKDMVWGHVVKAKVAKNKISVPYKEATVNLVYGKGFDNVAELADVAVEEGVITRSGAWYSLQDGKTDEQGKALTRWQGLEAVKNDIAVDDALFAKLQDLVDLAITRKKAGLVLIVPDDSPEEHEFIARLEGVNTDATDEA